MSSTRTHSRKGLGLILASAVLALMVFAATPDQADAHFPHDGLDFIDIDDRDFTFPEVPSPPNIGVEIDPNVPGGGPVCNPVLVLIDGMLVGVCSPSTPPPPPVPVTPPPIDVPVFVPGPIDFGPCVLIDLGGGGFEPAIDLICP